MKSKLLTAILSIFFLVTLLIFNVANVSAWEWDNTKKYDKVEQKVLIKNAFGFGKELMKITLIENTYECSENCYAILKINNYYEIPLSDKYTSSFGWEFDDLLRGGKKDINHNFQIAYNKSIVKIPVSNSCDPKLKSIDDKCIITYEDVEVYNWEDWDYKLNVLPKGEYYLKLNGIKKHNEVLDWKPTLIGVKINEWAKWGTVNSYANFTFDEADAGDNTGTGSFGDLTDSGGEILSGDCIDGTCWNTSSQGYASNAFNTQITTGGWAFWFKPDISTNSVGVNCFFIHDVGGANKGDFSIGIQGCNGYGSGGAITQQFNKGTGGVSSISSTTTNFLSGEWYHYYGKLNATGHYLYINGVKEASSTDGAGNMAWYGTGATSYAFGVSGTQYFNGTWDEAKFFNVELSDAQILDMYTTENLSISPTTLTNGTINLMHPPESYSTTETTIYFASNSSVVNGNISNATLMVGSLSNFTILSGTANQTNLSLSGLTDGFYNWTYEYCYENATDSLCNIATNRTFVIDNIAPQVTASLNETILYSEGQEVGLEYNITDSNLDSCWYTYNDINTSINCSETSTTITTTLSALDVVVYANDSLGNLNQSETLSMTLDPTMPEIVLSAGNETSGYYYSGVNHTINFTINDDNLDSIWWEYNGVNTLISPAISGEAQSITFEVDSGIYTATIYANDSIGNSNQLIVNWGYGLTEDSITFNPTTIEGSIEDYYLNVTLSGLSLTSATFYYDGVAKVSQIEADGNERFIKVEDFEVPSVTTDEDKEFYWTLIFSDETAINSTFNNQSVNNIGVDSCGGSYTYKLIDLYLKDEETTDTINGYIEVDYSLFNPTTQTIVQNYSYLFEGVNNVPICSDINLSSSNFLFDAQIRYYATNYSSELYNIQMGSLETPINLSLYYLAIDDSTEFLVTYQDENAIKVEGAIIQLLRKYISEGIYRVVEAPETSADGTAVLHIDLNSVIYDVIVIKDGVELDRFENVVFACDSAYSTLCTQKLYGTLDPGNSLPIETIDDFSYALTTFNDSIKLTYSITSGTPSNINMILEQTDSFGSKINCNESVVSSGGSIECGFNETIGDSVIKVLVLKDGEPMAIKSYVLEEDRRIEFLGNNYFIALIILLSVVAMAFSSPEWIVMNGVFTMLILGGLTLVRGLDFTIGLGSLMWLIVAGAILVMKISKQEDR